MSSSADYNCIHILIHKQASQIHILSSQTSVTHPCFHLTNRHTSTSSAHKQASRIHVFISLTATHSYSQLSNKRHASIFSSRKQASQIHVLASPTSVTHPSHFILFNSIALIFGAKQLNILIKKYPTPSSHSLPPSPDPRRTSEQNKNVKHNPLFKDIPRYVLGATGTVGLQLWLPSFWTIETNRPQMTHSQPAWRSHNTFFLLQKESDVYMVALTEQ